MSLDDMNEWAASDGLGGLPSGDGADAALGQALDALRSLAAGPVPEPSAALAAFMAPAAAATSLAAATPVTRSNPVSTALNSVFSKISAAGIGGKIAFGTAGFALAATTGTVAIQQVSDTSPTSGDTTSVSQAATPTVTTTASDTPTATISPSPTSTTLPVVTDPTAPATGSASPSASASASETPASSVVRLNNALVTAVSASSLSVTDTTGAAHTFVVSGTTQVTGFVKSISQVKVGYRVHVSATGDQATQVVVPGSNKKADKSAKPAKPAKAHKPEHAAKPEHGKPEHAAKPAKTHKAEAKDDSDEQEKAEAPEKAESSESGSHGGGHGGGNNGSKGHGKG